MTRRYSVPHFQKVYDAITAAAWDCSSELYYNHLPRRGAGHRCAFWDGFDGLKPAYIGPRTMGAVCLQAGRDFARAVTRKAALQCAA